jgi:uncharacterized integral membrane protein
MKRFFECLLCLLPHLAIILSVMLMVFLIIDSVNSAMNFINNTQTKLILWILSISSIINGIALVEVHIKKAQRKKHKPK